MSNNILKLAKEFISIKSIPENPGELEKILELALVNLKEYTIEKFERNGIKSALIYNSKKRPKKFKILLNGHLDVIPGKEHQYVPKIRGNRLYGVGSMDMKSNVACLIAVFRDVADRVSYPIGLQLVTDEQVGGFDGTKYQIEKGVKADFVIAGEPTNFDIVNKAKGILWLKIYTNGKSAHSAYHWKGENAIWKMNEFLNSIKKKYPNPEQEKWVTTINLSRIETANQVFNKIPDNCSVNLDVRYIPEEAGVILKSIKDLLPKEFKLEIIAKESALATSGNNEYLKILQKAGERIMKKKIYSRGAQGSSDARHFMQVNCAGIEFGPIGDDSGSDNEWVDILSLEKYYQILKTFLLSI